jgi:dihydrofolate reductase
MITMGKLPRPLLVARKADNCEADYHDNGLCRRSHARTRRTRRGSPPRLRARWLGCAALRQRGSGCLGQIYGRADAFLFGRWTYETFAGSWGAMKEIPPDNPIAVALNTRPKYVASTTLTDPKWAKTTVLSGDVAAAVRELKVKPGGELQLHGSGKFVRWLFANDLVDEINLHTYPLVLGQGKRLFVNPGPDKALELIESQSTPSGVIIQVCRPNGRPQYRTATMESTRNSTR